MREHPPLHRGGRHPYGEREGEGEESHAGPDWRDESEEAGREHDDRHAGAADEEHIGCSCPPAVQILPHTDGGEAGDPGVGRGGVEGRVPQLIDHGAAGDDHHEDDEREGPQQNTNGRPARSDSRYAWRSAHDGRRVRRSITAETTASTRSSSAVSTWIGSPRSMAMPPLYHPCINVSIQASLSARPQGRRSERT